MKTRIKVTTYESGKVTYTPQYYKERQFLWLDLSGWVDIMNAEYCDGYDFKGFCKPRDTLEEAQQDIDNYLKSISDNKIKSTDYAGYP